MGMEEINERFDVIKDKLHSNTMKNNQFVRILEDAYQLDPNLADKMWQYVVNKNEAEEFGSSIRNIYLLYTKLVDIMGLEKASDLLTMDFFRTKMFVEKSYALYPNRFGGILQAYLLKGLLAEAVQIVMIRENRDPYHHDTSDEILFQDLSQVFKPIINSDKLNAEGTTKFLKMVIEAADKKGTVLAAKLHCAFLTKTPLVSHNDIDDIIQLMETRYSSPSYLEFLYLEKEIITKPAEEYIFDYLQNPEIESDFYRVHDGQKDQQAVYEWYESIMLNSEKLMRFAFTTESMTSWKTRLLEKSFKSKNYDEFTKYIVYGLYNNDSKYLWDYIKYFSSIINKYAEEYDPDELINIDGKWYRAEKYEYVIDFSKLLPEELWKKTGIEPAKYTFEVKVPKLNRKGRGVIPYMPPEEIPNFLQMLVDVCNKTIDSPAHDELVERVSSFIKRKKNVEEALRRDLLGKLILLQ